MDQTITPFFKFYNASDEIGGAIPTIYRNVPGVANPIIVLQPKGQAPRTGIDVLVTKFSKDTLPRDVTLITTICIAGEGFKQNTPTTTFFNLITNRIFSPSTSYGVYRSPFNGLVDANGQIQAANITNDMSKNTETSNSGTTCPSINAQTCDADWIIQINKDVIASTDSAANPVARLYMTSPRLVTPGEAAVTSAECPPDLLDRIHAYQATLNPTTAAPSTAAPSTAAPSTAAPSTAAPSTAAPSTEAPSTNPPSTAAPSTAAPSTAAPSTATPTTVAPTNSTPSTAAPTTPAPTSPPLPFPVGTPFGRSTAFLFNGTALSVANANNLYNPAAWGSNVYISIWFKYPSSTFPAVGIRQTLLQVDARTSDAADTKVYNGLGVSLTRQGGTTQYPTFVMTGTVSDASKNFPTSGTITITPDTWHHLLFVNGNNDYGYVYLDGESQYSRINEGISNVNQNLIATNATIGGKRINLQGDVVEPFTGEIYQITVTGGYNELKTSNTQIASIYNSGTPILSEPGVNSPRTIYIFTNEIQQNQNDNQFSVIYTNNQTRFINQNNRAATDQDAVVSQNQAFIAFKSDGPGTYAPPTAAPTTTAPTTAAPTTASPTTASPSTPVPTTSSPTNANTATDTPTTPVPTTAKPANTATTITTSAVFITCVAGLVAMLF